MIPFALSLACIVPLAAPAANGHTPQSRGNTPHVTDTKRERETALQRLRPAIHARDTSHLDVARSIGRLGVEKEAAPVILDLLDFPTSAVVQERAFQALNALGERGTAAMIETVFDRFSWRMRYRHHGDEDKLAGHVYLALNHPDEQLRTSVGVSLAMMGENAAREIARAVEARGRARKLRAIQAAGTFRIHAQILLPALTRSFQAPDPELRYAAAHALGRLLPDSLPMLVRALGHKDKRIRLSAAEAIARAIPGGRVERVASGLAVLQQRSGEELEAESAVLRSLGGAVGSLAKALQDEHEGVRYFVAYSLYKLGDVATPARSALMAARNDPSSGVRMWVRRAEAATAGTRYALLHGLKGAPPERPISPQERERYLHALRSGRAWVLSEHTRSWGFTWPSRPDPRFEAVRHLARHDLDRLLRDLSSSSAAAREEARELLDRMQREAELHMQKLLRLLDDELATNGPAAKELVELGIAGLAPLTYDFVRYPRFPMGQPSYREMMWVFGKLGSLAVPTLVLGLDHWMPHGRELAAKELAKFGPNADVALPMIVSSWRADAVGIDGFPGTDTWWETLPPDVDWRERWISKGFYGPLLRAIGPPAIPALVGALSDEHALVRARAARALALLRAQDDSVQLAIYELLDDEQPFVRTSAAGALTRLAAADSVLARAAREVLAGKR